MDARSSTESEAGGCRSPLECIRARIAVARERWAGMSARRKWMIAGGMLLVLFIVLRKRGAPLVQVNLEVELTFRPVATTAVSLFGSAVANPAGAAEDDDG